MPTLEDARGIATHTRWPRRGPLLRSPLLESLGLVGGFTTRALGAMGGSLGTREQHAANRGALARSLGFEAVARVKQVHGDRVVPAPTPSAPWPEADGLWTAARGVLLGISAADCVPVLVAEQGSELLGAAHAGWKGTSLGVARVLVETLVTAGAHRDRLVAAVGPSIGPCCYTVDEERAALVRERLGPGFEDVVADGHFDLWTANARQLAAEDVRAVEVASVCTRCGGEDVWSYRGRADGGDYGTCLGFIGRGAS